MKHLHEKAKVLASFDSEDNKFSPLRIVWRGREYKVGEIGMHSTETIGGVLHHIFSAMTNSSLFVLHFNTKNLMWTVEDVIDSEESA